MISKELFAEAIESMQRIDKYQEAKNSVYRKFDADGYLIEPDNNAVVIKLLQEFFKECPEEEVIRSFCLENNYGSGKGNKTFVDNDGQKIRLDSPAALYDYLISFSHAEGSG